MQTFHSSKILDVKSFDLLSGRSTLFMVFPNVLRTCSVCAPYVLRTCSVVLHAFVRFAYLASSTAFRFGGLEWETAPHTHRLGTIVSYHSQNYPCHPSWLYLSSMCVAFGTETTRNHCLLPLPKLPMAPLLVSYRLFRFLRREHPPGLP